MHTVDFRRTQTARVLRQHAGDLEHCPSRQEDLGLGRDGRELADVDTAAGVDLRQQTRKQLC